MYSTHCSGQKMNSLSLFQSRDEFQKHGRRSSLLTPQDPQKKTMWGNAKEIAKCTTYKNCRCWVLLYILYGHNVTVCFVPGPLLFCTFPCKQIVYFILIWQSTSLQKNEVVEWVVKRSMWLWTKSQFTELRSRRTKGGKGKDFRSLVLVELRKEISKFMRTGNDSSKHLQLLKSFQNWEVDLWAARSRWKQRELVGGGTELVNCE